MTLRLLHTADWHLGRSLHGYSLIEDQAHALDQLIMIAGEARVDAVVIAGDVYDRAVPPPDAVELLDETLFRLMEIGVPIIAIAGNHDSPQRLAFGARLMAERGLHLVTQVRPERIVLGEFDVVAAAYCEPATARAMLGRDDIHDHGAMLQALLEGVPGTPGRQVFVGHLFLGGGATSESERPLSLGGAEQVPADMLAPFAYAALGHLHGPQSHNGGQTRYAGSLLKYSTSEAAHRKSVTVVSLEEGKAPLLEVVGLVPRRDLRVVRGSFDEILVLPKSEDYVRVVLDDARAVLDAEARLRDIFPNLIGIERPLYDPSSTPSDGLRSSRDPARGIPELFADFFEMRTGEQLDDASRRVFAGTLEDFQRQQREVAP